MTPARQSDNPIPEQVIARAEDLPACCAHIAAAGRFGFDTEFVGEDSYHPHLCLVQVSTPDRLFVIDPVTAGPLDAFWALVTDPANQVVVHAGREEVRLCRHWTGRAPGKLFDLQIAAGLVGLTYPLGHGGLVGQLLGVQLAKGEKLTEWRDRPLTAAQLRYAFDDVRYLLPLWEKLSERLERLGRASWADAEFARLAREASAPGPAPDKWRRLRGLGTLDRRTLAIVRELYGWREQAAERSNRPARAICRDDLLIEIARRRPTRERDLHVIRGLPRRTLGGVLEAVARALASPPEQWPSRGERDVEPAQVQLVVNVLSAVLGDFCARNELCPGLVANVSDLRTLVRARLQGAPLPPGLLLAEGWRGTHVLPELTAILTGQRSLRVADLNALAPFAFTDANANPPSRSV